MGPPADYPDFNGLVKEIARGTSYRRAKNEPIDHFLGHLESQRVEVQQLARSLLKSPNSKPNPLHGSLIRLFAGSRALRLVTTNFDSHFSTEAKRILGEEAEIFCAPALPVGNRFRGLVYIHGSVDVDEERLILTDGDFGRAYLTEGWARRFLLDLYANFVVLFVGYSHKDAVMQYLARGLAPRNQSRLFALTPVGNESHWEFLGITPIPYPLSNRPNKHKALHEAVAAWAELTSMSVFEHEERIREIATGAPPIIGSEDDDYLQSVVVDEDRFHFFAQSAKGKEWLFWTEERDLLAPLFSRRTGTELRHSTLAYWFAREFVVKHPELALGVLERQGQILSYTLWYEIARSFHATDEIEPSVLARWLPIILDQATPEDSQNLLCYVFEKVEKTGSWSLVLRLFEHLIRPHLQFRKSFSFFDSGRRDTTPTEGNLIIYGTHHWLKKTLDEILRPNFRNVAENLSRVCAYNIREAYDLGVFVKLSPEWDGRAAIEAHAQNSPKHDFDIVIDACRDSLEWLLHHRYEIARSHIEEWILSPAPLLRRIAVHGMCIDTRIYPESKLKWAVRHQLVKSYTLHHEFYELIKNAYPAASQADKELFLDQAHAVTQGEIEKNQTLDPGIFWHGLFTLLSWLDQAEDGKCAMVRGRLQNLKKLYPSFTVSNHPEFRFWSSGVQEMVVSESPLSIDELKEKPVKATVRFLALYKEASPFGPNRVGLLNALSTAVTQDPEWGLRIARELLGQQTLHKELWNRIFLGWAEADLTEEHWLIILNIVDRNQQLIQCEHAVTQLLERTARKGKAKLPFSLLSLAERTGRRLWTVASRRRKPRKMNSTDWLQTAINETGGDLAGFFMMAISLRRKHAGHHWTGIPREHKAQLRRIVIGKSYTAEMGRVILTSRIHFLFSSDPRWTRRNIVPLLSWERGERQASQAWHGYLIWGKWYDELLVDLFSLYEQSFGRLESDLQNVRLHFVAHVSSICVYSTRKRARGTWLKKFLRTVSQDDRKEFAGSILEIIQNLSSDQAAQVWHRWLDLYWADRIAGKPVPLEPDEASKMAEWAPHLESVFPQVVQRIKEMDFDLSVDSYYFAILAEKRLPDSYPVDTAELIARLIPSYRPVDDYYLDDVLERLLNHKETHSLLFPVINYMAAKRSNITDQYRKYFPRGEMPDR